MAPEEARLCLDLAIFSFVLKKQKQTKKQCRLNTSAINCSIHILDWCPGNLKERHWKLVCLPRLVLNRYTQISTEKRHPKSLHCSIFSVL